MYCDLADCSDQTQSSRFSSLLFGLFKNDILLLPKTEEEDQSANSISAVNQHFMTVFECARASALAEEGSVSEREQGTRPK